MSDPVTAGPIEIAVSVGLPGVASVAIADATAPAPPSVITVATGGTVQVGVSLEALVASPGAAAGSPAPAPSGSGGTSPEVAIIAGEALQAGAPVAVGRIDGKGYSARADVYAKASPIGLTSVNVASGFATTIATGSLTLADWTAITGFAALAQGQTYFLGVAPGTLSTAAPTAGGQSVTRVGIAATASTLLLELSTPILL